MGIATIEQHELTAPSSSKVPEVPPMGVQETTAGEVHEPDTPGDVAERRERERNRAEERIAPSALSVDPRSLLGGSTGSDGKLSRI
jgi:hypothetical protein